MTSAIDRCLDADAMRPLLQAALPACADGGAVIERVRIAKVRRSSSIQRNPHPLTLSYELVLRDADGQGTMLDVYAQLCRDGAQGATPPGAIRLAQPALLLWPWPADPGLPQLPELLDPHAAEAWAGRAGATVHVLRHEPERRATLRYAMADGGPAVYAKTFAGDEGAAIDRRFRHFRDAALGNPRAPLVAEPLGWCARTRTVWQGAAPGEPLAQAQPAGLPLRLAEAIAAVHAAPVALAGAARRDTAHWRTEIDRRARKIGRAVPALSVRAARLAGALAEQSARLPVAPPTLIHGDWHPGQVWIAGARAVLFDFDEFCLGDPMEDLASFAAKLPAAQGDLGTLMLATYAEAHPERFDLNRLHWHAAVQQLLQASRAFVFQVPGWQAELERRLARAEQLALPQPRNVAGVVA